LTPSGNLAVEAQLTADLADRTQRVDPLELSHRAIVDDLRIGHARHDRQVLTARDVSGK
jgi:hypothetical protein